MHKNATKCNKTQSKLCINKHGASKIIDTFETYHSEKVISVLTTLIAGAPTKLSIKLHASKAGAPRKLPPVRVSRTYLFQLDIPT
jgi:hypothetical protein